MSQYLTLHEEPGQLRRPVIILAFSGWNDAAESATTAARYLGQLWSSRPLASIDPEDFYHFGLSRPEVRFKPGSRTDRTALTMAAEARTLPGGDNTVRLVYRKGMLAALLLDAAIRRGSHGSSDLDAVARTVLAAARERRTHFVREAEIGAAVAAAGGRTAQREWARVVTGTEAVTARQVAAALRTVTGTDLPPPPERDIVPKELSRSPSR